MVVDKKRKPYKNGTMLLMEVMDASGSVKLVGWNDANEEFGEKIHLGKSYLFRGVVPQKGMHGKMECKIFRNTVVSKSEDSSICKDVLLSVEEAARKQPETRIVVKGVLSERDEVRKTKNGEDILRILLRDKTHDLTCYLLGEAASFFSRNEDVKEGWSLVLNGRMTERFTLFSSMDPLFAEKEEELQKEGDGEGKWWETGGETELASFSGITSLSSGTRVFLPSCLFLNVSDAPDGKKKTYLVGDKEGNSIKISAFESMKEEDKLDPSIQPGSYLAVRGKVSDYETKSINARRMEAESGKEASSSFSEEDYVCISKGKHSTQDVSSVLSLLPKERCSLKGTLKRKRGEEEDKEEFTIGDETGEVSLFYSRQEEEEIPFNKFLPSGKQEREITIVDAQRTEAGVLVYPNTLVY